MEASLKWGSHWGPHSLQRLPSKFARVQVLMGPFKQRWELTLPAVGAVLAVEGVRYPGAQAAKGAASRLPGGGAWLELRGHGGGMAAHGAELG